MVAGDVDHSVTGASYPITGNPERPRGFAPDQLKTASEFTGVGRVVSLSHR